MTGNSKAFPGFEKMYDMMQLGLGNRCFYAGFEDGVPHDELLRGEWTPAAPLKATWGMGKAKPEEIARGQTVSWFYLNARVQQLFRDHKLTGWSTYPIVLHDKAGEVCPGYAGLSITGRCGPIQQERSTPVPDHLRKPGSGDIMGLYFDESTWDGADLFCPAGKNSYMFVTEKVRDLFDEHQISGFDFTPLSKVTWYSRA